MRNEKGANRSLPRVAATSTAGIATKVSRCSHSIVNAIYLQHLIWSFTMLHSLLNSLRKPGSRSDGNNFSNMTINDVWNKALIVSGYDPRILRKDSCGAWIRCSDYGNASSDYGWEVDHIKPVAKGGGDSLPNLQPLHWKNNLHKSDNWPNWICTVKATH